MADCTKTAEFLREWGRMCIGTDCIFCPMDEMAQGGGFVCRTSVQIHPDDAIAIVQKWSDEHPVMTWMSKLVEKFPNAEKISMITGACPGWVFGTGPNMHRTGCDGRRERRCEECWNGEYKEEHNV